MAEAERWLATMKKRGTSGDVVSYNIILHGYSKAGCAEDCERWLLRMEDEHKVQANTVGYNAAITAYAKSSDYKGAERVLKRMMVKKVAPNTVTFTAVIDACGKA